MWSSKIIERLDLTNLMMVMMTIDVLVMKLPGTGSTLYSLYFSYQFLWHAPAWLMISGVNWIVKSPACVGEGWSGKWLSNSVSIHYSEHPSSNGDTKRFRFSREAWPTCWLWPAFEVETRLPLALKELENFSPEVSPATRFKKKAMQANGNRLRDGDRSELDVSRRMCRGKSYRFHKMNRFVLNIRNSYWTPLVLRNIMKKLTLTYKKKIVHYRH